MVTATKTQRPNRLRVLRAEHGLTQWDTAEAAGLTPNRYWLIEHGRTQPSADELARIAAVFGVSVRKAFPALKPTTAKVA